MTQLSPEQISELVNFERNQRVNLMPKATPAFSKQETLAILDAVSDRKVVTDNGEFTIEYDRPGGFWVQSTRGPWPYLPCGRFIIENALHRLSL